ncbi:MAG: hypothetical protein Q9M26_06670 [Mariprofundales bacterium]|nr:hypothetical protein [Mariprofundales bacterium]
MSNITLPTEIAPMNIALAAIPQDAAAPIQATARFYQYWAMRLCLLALLFAMTVLYIKPLAVAPMPDYVESARVLQVIVTPLMQDLHERDLKALAALRQANQQDFAEWHRHVPAFVDELTGLVRELDLAGTMVWDGKDVAGMAVQMRFHEMVVSPWLMQHRFESNMEAFRSQVEANSQDFQRDLGKQLLDTSIPPLLLTTLRQRLHAIQVQELELSGQLAVKSALAPMISTLIASLAQTVATRIIVRLPAQLVPSLLLKATKVNILSGLLFIGVDIALSDMVKKNMTDTIYAQMQQAKTTLDAMLTTQGNHSIQASEAALSEAIQTMIHDLEVK